jgi:hypothetical protein
VPLKVSLIDLSTSQQDELDSLLCPPSWRILSARELPSLFPESFRNKIDSALLIAQPTSTGGVYLGLSAHRVDVKDQAVDIEPFGVIVHSTGSSSVGAFVHHGSWEQRTQYPSVDFWEVVTISGIGDYYLANPPTGIREGTLEQLPKGDRGAFDAVILALQARKDDKE